MNTMIGSAGLKLAYAYLNSSPEKNIPKLMDWMDRLDRKNTMEGQRKAVDFALTACATLLAAALFAVLALFHRNLGSIIRRYSEQLRTVDERDLSFRLQPAGVLELQELVEAFNAKNENVAGVLSGVTRSADSLAQASSRLTETAGQLEKSSQRTNSRAPGGSSSVTVRGSRAASRRSISTASTPAPVSSSARPR